MIDKNDPRLTAYLLGELDEAAHEEVQSALSESAELRAHVEGLRGTIGMLQDAFADSGEDADRLTEDQLAAIDASVEAASKEDAPDLSKGSERTAAVRWVVAALVLLCAGMAWVSLHDFGPSQVVNIEKTREPEEILSKRDSEPGSEEAVAAVASQDVDSLTDSVWIDLGLPAGGQPRVDALATEEEELAQKQAAAGQGGEAVMGMMMMMGGMDEIDDSGGMVMEDGMGMDAMMGTEMEGKTGGMGMDDMMGMETEMMGMDMDDMMDMEMMMGMGGMVNGGAEGMGMSEAYEEPPVMYPEPGTWSELSRRRFDNAGQRRLQSSQLLEAGSGDGADPPDVFVQPRQNSEMLMETPRIMISEKAELSQTGFDPNTTKIRAKAEERLERAERSFNEYRERFLQNMGRTAKRISPDNLESLAEKTKLPQIASEEAEPVKPGLGDQESKRPPKTWKPASASTNRARLSVGHHDDLRLAARDTYVRIDGFRARVMFDLFYYNDRNRRLEGQFLLRLPDDASLHYFAFGPTNLSANRSQAIASVPRQMVGKGGADQETLESDVQSSLVRSLRQQTESVGSDLARRAIDPMYRSGSGSPFSDVKMAYVAPRQKAAKAYQETVRRRVDPALVEWAGPGIFQTKVFPLMPGKLHRIVVGYDITLTDDGSDQLFKLDLPEGEAGGRVEFDIAAIPGTEANVTPETMAFVSGQRAYYRYESAEPRDYQVRLTGAEQAVLRYQDKLSGDYFATRLHANLPDDVAKLETRDAVFLLDTSWSDRPAAFSRHVELLKQILDQNRDTIDRFAVMTFNVHQHWWRSEFSKNDETAVTELAKFADELVLEGATDLHGAIVEATSPSWQESRDSESSDLQKSRAGRSSGPETALPNYFLLSDAVATWGETGLSSIVAPLKDRPRSGGAMFVYDMAGQPSDRGVMRALADASAGAVFSIAAKDELTESASAHRSQPWRLADVSAEGADDVLVQGASSAIYPGQPLIVSGSGALSGEISLTFQRGSETKTISVDPSMTVQSPSAARMYGQLAVERLETVGQSLQEVSIAFARYFRVPGRTCSMVMLESKDDYERFGVKISPEDDLLVIGSTSVEETVSQQMKLMQDRMSSPKSRFLDWVKRMEDSSLLNVSTALRLAMRQMPDSSFQISPDRLVCKSYLKSHFQDPYLDTLAVDSPETERLFSEAEQSLIDFGVDDAIKTASTLIESKPSDMELLRRLAFRAIHWNRGDQAVHLMWRVVRSRGYQPQSLLLLARAFADAGQVESALVCLDLVSSGKWNNRWASSKGIADLEMLRLMTQVDLSESPLAGYARARKRQLIKEYLKVDDPPMKSAPDGFDFAVLIHWSTDRTDVDLHVTEPSGEICYYKNKKTESGGRLTMDVTQGLGPEMYLLQEAPAGGYHVQAKYFRGDQNRTTSPTEALVSVIQGLGREDAMVRTKRVILSDASGGEKEMHSILRWEMPGKRGDSTKGSSAEAANVGKE